MGNLNFFLISLIISTLICYCCAQSCPPRVRRSWHSLTREERDLFLDALQAAYDNGSYQTFAQIHLSNFPNTHFTSFFLPWHRWFIYKFENNLRSLGSRYRCLTIPYWNWESTSDQGTNYLFNRADFGSRVSGCLTDSRFSRWRFSGACIQRTWPRVSLCGEACVSDSLGSTSSFSSFQRSFEPVPHASPHNWCGGNLATSTSCRDPIFFLLHSNVDRLWGMWQDCKDQDRVNQNSMRSTHYTSIPANTYGIDDCMPYGNQRFFPECVSPRMAHKFQGNSLLSSLQYSYDDDSGMRDLLDNNFGDCNWNWQWPFRSSSPPPSSPPPSSSSDECRSERSCDDCTRTPHCGWCSGKCSTGTSSGPSNSRCSSDWAWTFRDCEDKRRSLANVENAEVVENVESVENVENVENVESSDESQNSYPDPDGYVKSNKDYKGNYYNQKVGGKPPSAQMTYVKGPGMFCNYYVQNAKVLLDTYYQVHKDLPEAHDKAKLNHLYNLAECDIENVDAYVTDDWITIMKMEHDKDVFKPPCKKGEKLPVNISAEYTL